MSLGYNKKNIPVAKVLRKNMTKQEKHLWYDFLSIYPIRFQRQKQRRSMLSMVNLRTKTEMHTV